MHQDPLLVWWRDHYRVPTFTSGYPLSVLKQGYSQLTWLIFALSRMAWNDVIHLNPMCAICTIYSVVLEKNVVACLLIQLIYAYNQLIITAAIQRYISRCDNYAILREGWHIRCDVVSVFHSMSGSRLNIKTVFLPIVIPIIKMRRSSDRLIFIMCITILSRWHPCIDTAPRFSFFPCIGILL